MNSNAAKTVWKRSKAIGILLAVFFGPWTWIYTYRRDPGKASVGLGWNVTPFFGLASDWLHNKIYPPSFSDGLGIFFLLGAILVAFAITWIAAVISSTVPRKWQFAGPETRLKETAVLLAGFVGPWTWLYTYKKDKGKFWAAIAIGLGGDLALSLLPPAVSGVVGSFWLPVLLGIWIAAFLNVVLRRHQWYEAYDVPLNLEQRTNPS